MWVALARGHAIKPRSGYRLQEAAERTPDSVIDRNFSAGSRARIAQPEALFRPGQRKRERGGGGVHISAGTSRSITETIPKRLEVATAADIPTLLSVPSFRQLSRSVPRGRENFSILNLPLEMGVVL